MEEFLELIRGGYAADIPPDVLVVYLHLLASACNLEDHTSIANKSGLPKLTVDRCIRELLARKWVKVVDGDYKLKPEDSNEYYSLECRTVTHRPMKFSQKLDLLKKNTIKAKTQIQREVDKSSRRTRQDSIRKIVQSGENKPKKKRASKYDLVFQTMRRRYKMQYGEEIMIIYSEDSAKIKRIVLAIKELYDCTEESAIERAAAYIDWTFNNHEDINKVLDGFRFNWNCFGSLKFFRMAREWRSQGSIGFKTTPPKKNSNRNTQQRTEGVKYDDDLFD